RTGRSPRVPSVGERLFGSLRRSAIGVFGLDRDIGAPAKSLAELHGAAFKRENRVIAAHADAIAGMKLCAALAHDDVARQHDLATEFLDAEPPPAAVAAVAGRAACLFMGHPLPPAPQSPSVPAAGPRDGCAC